MICGSGLEVDLPHLVLLLRVILSKKQPYHSTVEETDWYLEWVLPHSSLNDILKQHNAVYNLLQNSSGHVLRTLLTMEHVSMSTMLQKRSIHSSVQWKMNGGSTDMKSLKILFSFHMKHIRRHAVVRHNPKFGPYVIHLEKVPTVWSSRIPKVSLAIQWVSELKMQACSMG